MPTTPIIRLLVFALVFTLFIMPHAWGEQDCYHEKDVFLHKCALSIKRGLAYLPPNPICCRVVRKIDMTCVCRVIQPPEEENIDVRHAYFVSQDCGKPVPAGNKCGSWTIPGAEVPPPHHP
ncbi:hypothetical protein PVAP13_2NG093300 [Panicum virgatum]|uniref:Bifunctional inhibitor/plant lipid transfer protein/seed storage helical domain-containing protein n=1 Tax=Panicum virgatum TaxID=38727 RepID=A0A8T0VDB9_PANVG|nr:hypothetical protein PVAP13_2NG093300 [Panicum virgatum]